MPKILTKKERSKKWELSNYDIRSLIVQVCIVLVPYILANINDISILLEQWIWDPHATAIIITSLGLLLKKFMTNYEEKNK